MGEYDTSYRWVGQPGLFAYFYGDLPGEKMAPYVLQRGKMPKLPTRKDIIEGSFGVDDGNNLAVCMTVDSDYIGEPGSGEAVIRLIFDFTKMFNNLDKTKFVNLTDNGESEIRYKGDIPNWTDYIETIEILTEAFEDIYESDFGDYRAIKEWFPKDKMSLVSLIDSW